MSAATAPPQEEKLNNLISDLINAYSGQTEAPRSSAEGVARADEASSSSRRSRSDGDDKAAAAGKRATKEESSSGSSLARNDSKSTAGMSASTSKAGATPETGKRSEHEHRSHRHRDKDKERDRDRERDKDRERDRERREDRDKERDKKDRERDRDGEGRRTHKSRHRDGSKRDAREGKSDGTKEETGPVKEEEAEKEDERVIPPLGMDFKKTWSDLPDDVQRKVEKLRLPSELLSKYFKHLYTICRFLLKSSFPDTAAVTDKEPEKKEDIVVVKDAKGDSPAPSPALGTRAEEKGKRRPGRPTKVRNRAYATEAQMARAKQIVINAQKPMKKLYKSAEKSGQGGFGTVMVAKDVNAKQRVAIKKLPHNTPRMQENNWSEIAFLSMCKHPNIVQFQKAFIVKEKDQPEEVWIAMEYLEGGTLSEAARAHRFSDQHIAYVAHEILMALKYLHSLKLVHRDLKSANVMMSIKGEIKLIDFGLCADFSEGPRVKMLGSPYWIPPEMVWEMPHSYSADIWSMAVCILELYLANPPYPASSIKCMFMACTVGLADQIPEKATPEARDFLTRCFTLDPEQRPLPDTLLTHPWVTRPHLSSGIIDVLKQVFLTNSLESLGF